MLWSRLALVILALGQEIGFGAAQAQEGTLLIERQLAEAIQMHRNGQLSLAELNMQLTEARRALLSKLASSPGAPGPDPRDRKSGGREAYEQRFEQTIRETHKRTPLDDKPKDYPDHVRNLVARIEAVLNSTDTLERARRMQDLLALLHK